MKPTYFLIDTYEGNITIANNIRTPKDAYKAAYAWIEDTDGECNITFRPRYPAVDPFLEGDIRDQITRAFDDYFEND